MTNYQLGVATLADYFRYQVGLRCVHAQVCQPSPDSLTPALTVTMCIEAPVDIAIKWRVRDSLERRLLPRWSFSV